MVGYVVDVLLNADGRLLSTENLLSCARLFCLVQDPSLTVRARKYLHDQLLQYRTDLEQRTRALPAINVLCNDEVIPATRTVTFYTVSISQTAFSHVR